MNSAPANGSGFHAKTLVPWVVFLALLKNLGPMMVPGMMMGWRTSRMPGTERDISFRFVLPTASVIGTGNRDTVPDERENISIKL